MDEYEKAAINAVAKALLAPITKPIADLIGAYGGDQIDEYRQEKRERRHAQRDALAADTRKIIEDRGVVPDPNTPPERLEDIIDAAQDNSIPELRDLFARLAAAAADPARQASYRREFVDIVKKLEPLDTLVMPIVLEIHGDNWANKVAEKLKRPYDEVKVSGRNLEMLGCIATQRNHYIENNANLTPLGREFLRAVMD